MKDKSDVDSLFTPLADPRHIDRDDDIIVFVRFSSAAFPPLTFDLKRSEYFKFRPVECITESALNFAVPRGGDGAKAPVQ